MFLIDRFGDRCPDSSKRHLPLCLTKWSVYEMMIDEMTTEDDFDIVSESHFYKIWRQNLPHIVLPKVSSLCHHISLNI